MPRTTRSATTGCDAFFTLWSLTAVATRQPGYYPELAAARAGTATTIPVTDAVPDWAERVAAARDRR
jgi:hypothetical protein